MIVCVDCGAEVVRRSMNGPPPKWCGECVTKRHRDRMRRYRATHQSETTLKRDRDRLRRYREAHPDRHRAAVSRYRKANRKKVLEKNSRYRARKVGAYVAPVTTADVRRMMADQRGLCRICCADLDYTDYHMDHVIPLARGGTHEPGNVQLLCPKCNLSKGATVACP